MGLPGGHGVEGIAEVKGLRDGSTLGWGGCERKVNLGDGAAQRGQIDLRGTRNDQRMAARHAAEQVQAAFMMLDEFDAIARAAAAAELARGGERGMGEHDDTGRHRGSTFTGDNMPVITGDECGLDARDVEERTKHER